MLAADEPADALANEEAVVMNDDESKAAGNEADQPAEAEPEQPRYRRHRHDLGYCLYGANFGHGAGALVLFCQRARERGCGLLCL